MQIDLYGKELILDLHDCNQDKFNRESLRRYFGELCKLINMQACELYFWDDFGVVENEKQTSPHTKGTSAIQFILTSNVTIHTLDLLKNVYVNIFSCKDFSADIASKFTRDWFGGSIVNQKVIDRV